MERPQGGGQGTLVQSHLRSQQLPAPTASQESKRARAPSPPTLVSITGEQKNCPAEPGRPQNPDEDEMAAV